MPNISDDLFPLHEVAGTDLQCLGRVLWGWELCSNCDGQLKCANADCPWSRAEKLAGFWNWYKDITAMYVPEQVCKTAALRSHDDLLNIIRLIKTEPEQPRSHLTQHFFANRDDAQTGLPNPADQSRAFNMAARVLLMVNCGLSQHSIEILEYSQLPCPWRKDTSIALFIGESFPTSDNPYFDDHPDSPENDAIREAVTAKALKKRAKLRLEPTNDLTNHLRLDRRTGTVEIFHNTAVLKESLLASNSLNSTSTIGDCVRTYVRLETFIGIPTLTHLSGNIPRALALETLDTIHNILFPSDKESQALLSSLVSHSSFDKDCRNYESAAYGKEDEKNSQYRYWGARLVELYNESQKPTPRGWLQTWLERKSGARYVMMATLVGVIIAILIGFLSLGVAGFQAWVAWQQWKHPLSSG